MQDMELITKLEQTFGIYPFMPSFHKMVEHV